MANKDAKVNNKKIKENSKNKKSFFKGFKAELKKVIWPTPKQLVNNTVAVITIVLLTTLIVFVLDLAFESMNKYGVDKLKEVISNTNSVTENATQDNTTSDNTVASDNETSNTTEAQATEDNTVANEGETGTNTEETNTGNVQIQENVAE